MLGGENPGMDINDHVMYMCFFPQAKRSFKNVAILVGRISLLGMYVALLKLSNQWPEDY